MAQDVPLMRQVRVAEIGKGVFGTLSLGVTEATGLAGSVGVQVGFAVSGSSVFLGNPFWAGFDLRLKAESLATENGGLFWESSLLVHWFESGLVGLPSFEICFFGPGL